MFELGVMERGSIEQYWGTVADVPIIPACLVDIRPDRIGISADKIPDISDVRQQARQQAEMILEQNRELNRQGMHDLVPLDVDALGTVEKVETIGEVYGKHSTEYREASQGLVLDYARKLAEAFRKNDEEYFDPIEHTYDPESDMVFADGLPVDSMLTNGLSPLAEQEETALRINDYVLHETKKALVRNPDADHMGVVHIMPCPDWAIQSYERNPKGAHGGYAPGVKKMMLGYSWFDHKQNKMYYEQIAAPGQLFTPKVMRKAQQIIDDTLQDTEVKTEIHGTHNVVDKRLVGSVMDMQKLLDHVASEEYGFEVFMGKRLAPGQEKNYDQLYVDAARRRKEQAGLTNELVAYVHSLYEADIDHTFATHMVEKFIKDRLLDEAEKDHRIAAAAFDAETASGFREATRLRALGEFSQAESIINETRLRAPDTGSCGAGSCGLESVDLNSEEGKKLAKNTKAESGDTIVRDKERRCKCGAKEIVYAYNKNKVNKYCGNCKAFESKVTKNGK